MAENEVHERAGGGVADEPDKVNDSFREQRQWQKVWSVLLLITIL